jgi:hypothetical protein
MKENLPVRFLTVRDAVEDAIAVAAIDDHSGVFQVGEMSGDIRL